MSYEDKEEKDIMEAVYCRGVNKLLNIKNCNKNCDHFRGIKVEPVIQKIDNIEKKIGENRWVECGYPRQEKIHTICEVD